MRSGNSKRNIWTDASAYGTYEGERGSPSQWRSEFHNRFTKEEIAVILDSDSPYDILGISCNATDSEIKKAFINLIKIHHPDRGGNTERAQKIIAAYQQLVN